MASKEKVLDDLARMAGGTVGLLSDLGRSIKDDIRTRTDEIASRLDLVPREDFERLETVLQETRKRLEAAEKRIAKLESPASAKSSEKHTKTKTRTQKKT